MRTLTRIALTGLFFGFMACSPAAKEEAELREVVEALNDKCPVMVDSETRIDGIVVPAENTLRYNYTLVNLQVQNVDTHEFRMALWPGILSVIKVSREMKKLRDNHTVIEYYYADKNSKPIYTFTILPEHYQEN